MLTMRRLLLGVAFVTLIGFGGFFYRNAVEYRDRKISCPVDEFVCPDGTTLTHSEFSCVFPTCPLPNVTLEELGLTFALPNGFTEVAAGGELVARYEAPGPSEFESKSIEIRKYPLTASSTPLAVIQESAIGATSGLPVSPSRFTSVTLGGRTFTVVPIDRFEAVVVTAYYLVRPSEVVRFDAIDRGVVEWMNPELDTTTLPTQAALRSMLTKLLGS